VVGAVVLFGSAGTGATRHDLAGGIGFVVRPMMASALLVLVSAVTGFCGHDVAPSWFRGGRGGPVCGCVGLLVKLAALITNHRAVEGTESKQWPPCPPRNQCRAYAILICAGRGSSLNHLGARHHRSHDETTTTSSIVAA